MTQTRFSSAKYCATCGKESGDTDNNGTIVHAGFGSSLDETQFVWIMPGDTGAKEGIICDTCIGIAVADGRLEAFFSVFDETTGLHLSEAAYRALFAYGARSAYQSYRDARGTEVYQPARQPDRLKSAVVAMRNEVSGDDTFHSHARFPRDALGWRAKSIGYAHAVAAIAYGCIEVDPEFELAAAEWASARIARDRQIDQAAKEQDDLLADLIKLAGSSDHPLD